MVDSFENSFIFLDRDGTVIVDKHYLSDYREVELLPRAAEGLIQLKDLGFKFIVVTNQSGLARGYFTEDDLRKIHIRMLELLNDKGISIEDILYCPHHPDDNCLCRKPGTKLVEDAARKYNFDYQKCFVIGDKQSDIIMGKRLGAKTFLIKNNKDEIEKISIGSEPDFIIEDIMGAALIIQELPPFK